MTTSVLVTALAVACFELGRWHGTRVARWKAHADRLVDATTDSRGRHPSRLEARR